jgi:hypothetical protein
MLVSVILFIILSALVMTLNVGEMASCIGSAKVDLEAEVKMLVDWITRDIRQAKIQELYNNTPTTDHVKFNLWVWDNATFEQQNTDQYVEYEYDSPNQTLSRRLIEDDATANEWNFTDISMSPFYTSYTNETVNSFNSTILLNTRRLIVAIKKSKTVRNRPLNSTMVEEVKIRNE